MNYTPQLDGFRSWELWVRWKAITGGYRHPSNLEELFWVLRFGTNR